MSRRVLFCWEIGEGSGHVVPYLSLLTVLRSRGWEVAVAARNTAEIGRRVQACGATLLQAPVCLGIFPELDRQSFSTTESLLQCGYGYTPTLDGIFSAWRGMMETWRPDLVIGSAAPTAQLVAQALGIVDIAIGSGFNCPPALSPAPMIRPWQAAMAERLAVSEDRALQTINAVLSQHGFSNRKFPMDMYLNVPALLCTVAALDHYGAHRGDSAARYLGMLPPMKTVATDEPKSATKAITNAVANPAEIFVYLRYEPRVEPLLAALAKRGASTIVFMPNLTQAQYAKLTALYPPTITVVMHAVDIDAVLRGAKLVISNAGHNITLQTLLAGCPLLLLPTHWEQHTVAQLAAKTGAAINISVHEHNPKFKRFLDELLDNSVYKTAAVTFAARHAGMTAEMALQQAIVECERLANLNVAKLPARQLPQAPQVSQIKYAQT